MLIATANKFNVTAPYRVHPLEEYDFIITDADDATVEKLRAKGLKIYNR